MLPGLVIAKEAGTCSGGIEGNEGLLEWEIWRKWV